MGQINWEEEIRRLTDDPRVQTGALYGGGAYLIGYLVSYLITLGGGRWQIPKFKAAGLIFYGMHFVPPYSSAVMGSVTTGGSFEWLGSAIFLALAGILWWYDGISDKWAYGAATIGLIYAVPIAGLLLIPAGYLVVSRSRPVSTQWTYGAAIVAGYLPLTILGTFLFSVQARGFVRTTTISPHFVPAFFFMGLLIPGVYGAFGGRIAVWRQNGT